MARHQLALAIIEDNWRAVESTRTQHPQYSFCNDALLKLAAQAGAIGVASWLQCQGADPFGPDAAESAFYAALRGGSGSVASQMLAFRQLMNPASFPDLKPFLAAALDNRDSAAISLLLQFSVQLESLMPFDLLAQAIATDNARRIALLISQRSMFLALQSPTAERTVVHFAIRHGSAATLGLLLNRASGVERATRLCERNDSTGNTALHRAVASGDLDKLRLILDFDPGARTAAGSISAENSDGKTALALALQAGRTDMVNLLRSSGTHAPVSTASN